MLHMKKPNSLLKKMVGFLKRFLMAFWVIHRISKEGWDFDTADYLTFFFFFNANCLQLQNEEIKCLYLTFMLFMLRVVQVFIGKYKDSPHLKLMYCWNTNS